MKRLVAVVTASVLLTALAQPVFAACDREKVVREASFEQLLSDALAANQLKVSQEINIDLQHSLWLASVTLAEKLPLANDGILTQSIAKLENE